MKKKLKKLVENELSKLSQKNNNDKKINNK